MQRSLEQRMAIKFCVKLEKSAAETIPMLKKASVCSARQISGGTGPRGRKKLFLYKICGREYKKSQMHLKIIGKFCLTFRDN
ncbi:hypothetical protein NQ318_006817 [Aromia moschata]|uniref:Uncharacterized protein n=1 Tax=Aromia moschata TaxID=1265417 RepID=A0AAV8XTI9_9CUCU|nr:hypothetical protein NQ318_006817 [Aromia moschata]